MLKVFQFLSGVFFVAVFLTAIFLAMVAVAESRWLAGVGLLGCGVACLLWAGAALEACVGRTDN